MAAQTKKKTDDLDTSAAEAAIVEAGPPDIVFTVRGQEFVIPRIRLISSEFLMAMAGRAVHEQVYALLGREDAARFVALAKEGETFYDNAAEFLEAFNAAAGLGNSPTS